jgi:hypothetical protein
MTAAAPREPQTSPAVLMVRPAHFAANAETAGSNHFQRQAGGGLEVAARAAREFDALAVALAAAGVRVHAFRGPDGRRPARRSVPEQLAQLACRRHRGALPDARAEP